LLFCMPPSFFFFLSYLLHVVDGLFQLVYILQLFGNPIPFLFISSLTPCILLMLFIVRLNQIFFVFHLFFQLLFELLHIFLLFVSRRLNVFYFFYLLPNFCTLLENSF